MTTKNYFPATAMPDADWWTALWPDPEQTLKDLGIGAGQTVLDLCCGDGYFTAPLCRLLGPQGRLYALDMDPEQLTAAQDLMARQGPDHANETCVWMEADACLVDKLLGDRVPGGVDVVLMANSFHGVPDKPALAKAVRRVLKPRGRFVVVNWHVRERQETTVLDQPRGPKTTMRLSPEDVRQTLSAAGFTGQQIVELPPFHYGSVMRVANP